ncbi:MAG: hypothetical protein O6952_09025 [Planctomycetota bacterium]|nr:hypothetical protein [Planctomycetota bacterium]
MDAKRGGGEKTEPPIEIFLSIIDPRLDGMVRRALREAGHRSFAVPGGLAGWKVIEQLTPPILIMEIPEGDLGQISLLERIERNRKTRATPVLVFTKDLRLEFRLRGVYEYFHDYTAIARCMETVEEVIGRIHGRRKGSSAPMLKMEDYKALEDVIHVKIGLTLKRERVKRVEDAVRRRMSALKLDSFQEYISRLRHGEVENGEWKRLIPALTVEETSFFRTTDHFWALRELAIPSLLQRKVRGEPIRVWCAGCSSGEEAYSVAMALRECGFDTKTHPIQVIATDINERLLEKARETGYSKRAVRKIPAPLLKKYFARVGDLYYPEASLRRSVVFQNFNLQNPASSFRELFPLPVDAVFCRNVVIYFRKVTIQRLVESFYSILAEKGYLFLGYSETLYKFRHRFQTLFWRETFFYQKRPAGEAPTPPNVRSAALPTLDPARGEKAPDPDTKPPTEIDEPIEPASPTPPAPERIASEADAPDPYALMAAGDNSGAEALFADGDNPSWDSLIGQAYACVMARKLEAAGKFLEQILARSDVSPEAYYISGLINQSKGEAPTAKADYERAIFLDRKFYPAHVQLGELNAGMGWSEVAIRCFRNAIECIPTSGTEYLVTLEGVFPTHRAKEILEDAILEMEEAIS